MWTSLQRPMTLQRCSPISARWAIAWQAAIKALYAKGIMTGRDATCWYLLALRATTPSFHTKPITRAEMGVYSAELQFVLLHLICSRATGELADVEQLDMFPDAHTQYSRCSVHRHRRNLRTGDHDR